MAPVSILLLLLLLTIGPRYAPYVAAQTENQPPPPRVHNPKPTPTMAIILICLISTFFLTCFFSIYVHRCVNRQMADSFTLFPAGTGGQGWPWRTEPRGLDPAVVAAFPTFIYSEVKELKIGKDVLECAVCLNEFEDEEALQLLPKCWHVFHPDCIQSWLNSHVTCPVCRADLMPEPSQTLRVPSPSRDPVTEPVIVRAVDDSMVRIQSPDAISAVGSSPKKVFPPISTSRKERRIRGEFRKSLSTGHSLVLPVENCERFTLRLPEEVRNRLVNTSLERAKSCHVVFPRARSSRKGFRSTSSGGNGLGGEFNEYERFDRNGRPHQWVFTATPPFFSRAGPVRSPVGHGGGGGPVRLLKSVASPLNRLFGRTNSRKVEVEVEVGERSSDVLRAEDEV